MDTPRVMNDALDAGAFVAFIYRLKGTQARLGNGDGLRGFARRPECRGGPVTTGAGIKPCQGCNSPSRPLRNPRAADNAERSGNQCLQNRFNP